MIDATACRVDGRCYAHSWMDEDAAAWELTEPEPADSVFVTGIALVADAHTAQLVAYQDIENMSERRILARWGMSIDTAEHLYLDLWKALREQKRKVALPPSHS